MRRRSNETLEEIFTPKNDTIDNGMNFPTNSTELPELNSTTSSDMVFNWTNPELLLNATISTDEDYTTRNRYIYIYTAFIIGCIVLTTFRAMFFYKVCMNASKNLHNSMFSNVIQATMRFFDTNASGECL